MSVKLIDMPVVMYGGVIRHDPEKVTGGGLVENEFTGTVQRIGSHRSQYRAQWTFRAFKKAEEPDVFEFLNQIDTSENVFRAPWPGLIRRGQGRGTPLLSALHTAYASELNLSGLSPNVGRAIVAGDGLEVGGHGCLALTTASSDSAGGAVVEVFPRLPREMPAGAVVRLVNPRFIWRIEAAASWQMKGAHQRRMNTSFSAITEVLYEGHSILTNL